MQDYVAPSCATIRRWMQKLGYCKLYHADIQKDNWMLIIDASIQMGDQKCLVVLGCRTDDLPKDRALTLEDLTPLGLRVVRGLTAEVIEETLYNTKRIVGDVVSICSDRGSDVLRGIKDFQKSNRITMNACDTAHRIANFLKSYLERDARWVSFRKKVTQVRSRAQDIKRVFLIAPTFWISNGGFLKKQIVRRT